MEFIKHTNKPQAFLNLSNSEAHTFLWGGDGPIAGGAQAEACAKSVDEVLDSGQRLEFLQAAITC